MPKRSPHPYVVWRDGRPRFVPSPELRAAGYKGFDLRHPADRPDGAPASDEIVLEELKGGARNTGTWFTRGEAVDWSDAFVKSLAEQQKAATAARPAAATRSEAERAKEGISLPAPPEPQAAQQPVRGVRQSGIEQRVTVSYTVAQLFEDWFRSSKFQLPADPAERRRMIAARVCYSPRTIADYRQKAGVIERADGELWWSPADALVTPVVYGLYDRLLAARGIATARGAIAVLSIALGWGRRRGKVSFRMNDGANPAHDLDMATPPPRIRVASRAEVAALVAAADALGRPEAGDMIVLGVWTGQRQGDRLALEDRGLVKGRRLFRQSKTGAIVAVRETPELKSRLAASVERRRGARAQALLDAGADEEARRRAERRFARVILNELVDSRYGKCFWRPFEGQTYSHLFAQVRAQAAKAVPSVADLTDPDLRDTAVTWMALGGATIPEICGVTGHSLQSATRVLKHYLAMHPEMADAAIGKMLAWYDDGEEEIGAF